MLWLEVVGWAGSVVLVVSLLQTRVLRLRALNLVAAVILVFYNAALAVWPMVAVNVAISLINVVHLTRLARARDDDLSFEVVRVGPSEDYLQHVLSKHARDIDRHNPGFTWDGDVPGAHAYLVLRDTETVGVVLLCSVPGDEPDVARVELDYVLPRYRDFSVGKFVYRRDGMLARDGLRHLLAPTDRMVDARTYFPRVGFAPDPQQPDRLVLHLGRPRTAPAPEH